MSLMKCQMNKIQVTRFSIKTEKEGIKKNPDKYKQEEMQKVPDLVNTLNKTSLNNFQKHIRITQTYKKISTYKKETKMKNMSQN